MRKIHLILLIGLGIFLLFGGCKKGTVTLQEEVQYTLEDLIAQGWAAFEEGNYMTAKDKFYSAKMKDPLEKEVYSGLGWSFFKLDSLEQASNEFNICACLSEPTADIAAGWAFTLNTMKEYASSTEKASTALVLNPSWVFSHGLSLDIRDLHLLKAEHYYLLGYFAESLAEVKILNPVFTADVTTDFGRSELAAEIERLKGEV